MSKRKAAVYLDHKQAYIVSNHDGQNVHGFAQTAEIESDDVAESTWPKHLSEHRVNNSEQTELRKFFTSIEQKLTNTQELYVTGYGTAQEEFKHFLHDTAQYKNLPIELGTTDKMDEASFKRHAMEYFK